VATPTSFFISAWAQARFFCVLRWPSVCAASSLWYSNSRVPTGSATSRAPLWIKSCAGTASTIASATCHPCKRIRSVCRPALGRYLQAWPEGLAPCSIHGQHPSFSNSTRMPMSDPVYVDVTALSSRLQAFVDERHWGQFHSPKNLVMAPRFPSRELIDAVLDHVDSSSISFSSSADPVSVRCRSSSDQLPIETRFDRLWCRLDGI
jgi:hypothetical protein